MTKTAVIVLLMGWVGLSSAACGWAAGNIVSHEKVLAKRFSL